MDSTENQLSVCNCYLETFFFFSVLFFGKKYSNIFLISKTCTGNLYNFMIDGYVNSVYMLCDPAFDYGKLCGSRSTASLYLIPYRLWACTIYSLYLLCSKLCLSVFPFLFRPVCRRRWSNAVFSSWVWLWISCTARVSSIVMWSQKTFCFSTASADVWNWQI